MTRAEFFTAFRGKMMVFLADAWAARKETPASLGLTMDLHCNRMKEILNEIYDALNKEKTNADVTKRPRTPDASDAAGRGGANTVTANGRRDSLDLSDCPLPQSGVTNGTGKDHDVHF